MICKKALLFVTLLILCCLSITVRGEEMIDTLRKVFRNKEPVQIGTKGDVIELKYPAQKYIHTMDMAITGEGSIEKKRWGGLFTTTESINIAHMTKLIMEETVVSTPEELEQGIIRCEYVVYSLLEELAQVDWEYKVGKYSTKDVFDDLKTISEKMGSESLDRKKWGWYLIPGVGQYKVLNKFFVWIDNTINSDGTIRLSEKQLKKLFPEYKALIQKLSELEDLIVTSRWEYGKGYTSVIFDSKNLDNDTKLALAKLIYRTNPISIKEILPDGKRTGDEWTITSETIGGIVFDLGLDFDDVEGSLRCVHSGPELLRGEDLPDEYTLLKNSRLRTQAVKISKDERNLLSLVSHSSDSGDISLSFSPYGVFRIFDDYDSKGRHIYYLKEAHMEGIVKSKVTRRTSLLEGVNFKKGNIKVKLNYVQTRMGE